MGAGGGRAELHVGFGVGQGHDLGDHPLSGEAQQPCKAAGRAGDHEDEEDPGADRHDPAVLEVHQAGQTEDDEGPEHSAIDRTEPPDDHHRHEQQGGGGGEPHSIDSALVYGEDHAPQGCDAA